jgi:hypothetical protein
MLRIIDLKDYKKPETLDKGLRNEFLHCLQNKKCISESKATKFLFCFEIFLDCRNEKLTLIDLNENISELYLDFFAFIYSILNTSISSKYEIIYYFSDAIFLLHDKKNIQRPSLPKPSYKTISPEIKACIENANFKKIIKDKIKYYNGWHANSSDQKEIKLYLHNFYLHFGKNLTELLYNSMKKFYIKYPYSTGRYKAKSFSMFINCLRYLFKDEKSFYEGGTSENVTKTVEQAFILCKIENKMKDNDLKYFYRTWSSIVKLISDIFIEYGIWKKPYYDFIVPEFKSASKSFKTHRKIIDGAIYSEKLTVDIPLFYTDSEAIARLLTRLDDDISHIVIASKRAISDIMNGYENRLSNAARGQARSFTEDNFRQSDCFVDITKNENRCATWEKYNYKLNSKKVGANRFLELDGKSNQFIKKYSILQTDMLYPFLFLLVYEHPAITNSWIESFNLFDKNGNSVGFIESNDSKLAVGYKPRRSFSNAEQKIVLNKNSEYLFNCLLKLTAQARNYLKETGSEEYKNLLISGKNFAQPKKISYLKSQKTLDGSSFNNYLLTASDFADENRSKELISNLTLSKFRASRAIQIYLKTNNIEALSEALGHKEPNPRLLERYLPDPIIKFFQDRWIRIFQNSIIYEAMKDSDFLFDAIDISESSLKQFLENYRLKPLPKHILNGQLNDLSYLFNLDNEIPNKDKLIVPLSHTLLSILKCIVHLVDNNSKSNKLTKTAIDWYDTARYITKSIKETQALRNDPDLKGIIDSSKDYLSLTKIIKGAIYES